MMTFVSPAEASLLLPWLGRGNHDLTVCKNNGTDMVRRAVEALGRAGSHAGVQRLSWLDTVSLSRPPGRQSSWESRSLQTHGKGGEAPTTKGVIDSARRATYLPDADIVMSGHRHESTYVEQARFRLSSCGKEYQDIQYHVAIPTYKDEFQDRFGVSDREVRAHPSL